MKIFLFAILVILAPVLVSSLIFHENCRFWEFLEFKYNNNLVYPNAAVEFHRCKVFTENLKMIERNNDLFKIGKSSFSMAVNKFADQTSEEFIALNTGLAPVVDNFTTTTQKPVSASDEHQISAHIRLKRATATWTVPSTFKPGNLDLRKASLPVRNQGTCGSCWAFSAIGLLEYYFLKKYGYSYDLSEQQLVDCDSGNNGCSSGFPYKALAYARNYGTDYESVYPYKNKAQSCYIQPTNNGNYGVAAVGINIEALQFYSSGIITVDQCKTGVNHAVIVVGYGTDDSGTKYWLIRNSFGPDWGESGYFRLERDKNACDIMNSNYIYRVYVA